MLFYPRFLTFLYQIKGLFTTNIGVGNVITMHGKGRLYTETAFAMVPYNQNLCRVEHERIFNN